MRLRWLAQGIDDPTSATLVQPGTRWATAIWPWWWLTWVDEKWLQEPGGGSASGARGVRHHGLKPKMGIGFSNAIGRPKKGPEKAPGRARRGPKYASLGGFSAQSGRLQARGWRAGRSLNVHGAQDWPGLRVDPDVGHGLPTQRAAPPAAAGYPQPAAIGIRQRKRLKQRSAAPPRAPDPWAAAEGPSPGEQGSSRSPAAPGWRR